MRLSRYEIFSKKMTSLVAVFTLSIVVVDIGFPLLEPLPSLSQGLPNQLTFL